MFTKATFTLPMPSALPFTHSIQPDGQVIILRSLQGVTHLVAVLIKQEGEIFATKEQLGIVANISNFLLKHNPSIEITYKGAANPLSPSVTLKDCRQLPLFKPPRGV